MAHTPRMAHCLILLIKFYWNTALPIRLYIVWGCFSATGMELSSCERNVWPAKPQIYTAAVLLLSHFSRVRLCEPIGSSPPGSAVPWILQARILEWVAISVSNAIRLLIANLCGSCSECQGHPVCRWPQISFSPDCRCVGSYQLKTSS